MRYSLQSSYPDDHRPGRPLFRSVLVTFGTGRPDFTHSNVSTRSNSLRTESSCVVLSEDVPHPLETVRPGSPFLSSFQEGNTLVTPTFRLLFSFFHAQRFPSFENVPRTVVNVVGPFCSFIVVDFIGISLEQSFISVLRTS